MRVSSLNIKEETRMDVSDNKELRALIRQAVAEAFAEYQPRLLATVQEAVREAIIENIEIIVEDSSELLDGEP
jgi:hypothetical protein